MALRCRRGCGGQPSVPCHFAEQREQKYSRRTNACLCKGSGRRPGVRQHYPTRVLRDRRSSGTRRPFRRPLGTGNVRSAVWQGTTLVIETKRASDLVVEQREVWSLDDQGRLQVVITGSGTSPK